MLTATPAPPACVAPSRKGRRWWPWWMLGSLALLGAACVCMSLWVAVADTEYIFPARDVPAQSVALVLGASVHGQRLSMPLEDRMRAAVALYHARTVRKLLLSGDHGEASYDEVSAMKRFAIERGVRPEDLFLDHAGFSTYESCYRAREVFGLRRLVIVSSAFHLPRALYIARGLGLDAVGAQPDEREYAHEARNRLREFFARIKAFLWVNVLRPEPLFLGPAIDMEGDGRETHS